MSVRPGWLRKASAHPGEDLPNEVEALRTGLDRPLLLAGMVQNEGEPGGGPFWLRDDEGTLRAQIVESAEMDTTDPLIQDRMGRATHFNPVDLVCALHDASRQSVSVVGIRRCIARLSRVQIPRRKILEGGLEHPGLWNGAMGRWNTVFVEVDPATFAPVKTVFDLLRPAHRWA